MKKLGGIGILGLLAIVAGAFLVLNYFNVISLSQLYPKYFGSLPHAPTNLFRENPKSFVLVSPILEKDVNSIKESPDGRLMYFLKNNAQLYPALTGTVSQGGGVIKTQSFNIIWITHNSGQKLEYKYIGTLIGFKDKVSVRETNPFIQLRDQRIHAQQDASLILTLYDISGKVKKLSKGDFAPRK